MPFNNLPVHLPDLPRVAALQFQPLDPKSKLSEYIASVIFFAILFVIANIVVFTNGGGLKWWVLAIYLGWLALFGFALWLVGKNYEVTGYAMRQRDIIF